MTTSQNPFCCCTFSITALPIALNGTLIALALMFYALASSILCPILATSGSV